MTKGLGQITLQGRENNLCSGEINLVARRVVKTTMDRAFLGVYDVLNAGKRATREMNAQRLHGTRIG